jgi:hypothetical protein
MCRVNEIRSVCGNSNDSGVGTDSHDSVDMIVDVRGNRS